ncbi:MAG: TIGR04076 family protein [Dehalococcoidia bacterium]
MTRQSEVVARIVSQKGTCSAGHKAGDEFPIGGKTPAGMCSYAFYAIFPVVATLQFGGSLPWEDDPDKATLACPDPANPVVFELKRGRK